MFRFELLSKQQNNSPQTSASSSVEATTTTLKQRISSPKLPRTLKRLRRTKEQLRSGVTLEELKKKDTSFYGAIKCCNNLVII